MGLEAAFGTRYVHSHTIHHPNRASDSSNPFKEAAFYLYRHTLLSDFVQVVCSRAGTHHHHHHGSSRPRGRRL